MADDLPRSIRLDDDDVYAFIDDEVIMLKAVSGSDPVGLSEDSAAKLAEWLLAWSMRLDVPPRDLRG